LRHKKFSIIRITLVAIVLALISSSSIGVFDNTNISFGQTVSSAQQQAPPMGVKITSPSRDDNITIGNHNNFEISGTSTDNTTTDCKVSVILNNVKPYQDAIPAGPGGDGDYSAWSFSLNPSYNATVKEGSNKLTAKQTCANPNEFASSDLVKHYSVFFNGIRDVSNSNSRADETPPTTNSISALQQGEIEINQQQQQTRQEQKQQPPSSVATLETQLKNNDTIAQLSTSLSRPTDDSERENTNVANNGQETTSTEAATTNSISSEDGSTRPMTFTIYQEGRLNASSDNTRQIGITTSTSTQNVDSAFPSQKASSCNENLPISRFSAIGDDGDDAIPQNAFDNNLQTRWSHDNIGSWIMVDLGSNNAVCFVDIAWYRGNERSYDFIISLSEDGINFKDVYAGTSTGNTLSPERYSAVERNPSSSNKATAAEMARYVRITVNGNTESDMDENQWAAITEIDVSGSGSGGFDGTGTEQTPLTVETQGTLSSASSSSSSEQAGKHGENAMILRISGIYEPQNKNIGSLPSLDPSGLEGTLSILDSTTNKKIEEYDLAPINIAFTQLFKKITVTTGIDDPILNGSVTSTLKFPSSIDLNSEGNYTSESIIGTIGNMLLAKISGEQPYGILGDAKGSITIRPLTTS
jgi:F5/8 type C domain